MPPTTDEDAALTAIATFSNDLSVSQRTAHEKITAILNDASPFVDIHELLALYNVLYFRSLLLPRVEGSWSARLTLCAGICELVKDETGKYRRIRLKLSEPLLKFRPRSDTINTLLHEAIHAYFFITTSWAHSRGDDGTGHGTGFLLLADAISNHGRYEITVYHTFHNEVDSLRAHVWKCEGACQRQPPYFGFVKRSMNRPPSKSDPWWDKHVQECGGTYVKIAEPELSKAQIMAMSAKQRAGKQKNKIDAWVLNEITPAKATSSSLKDSASVDSATVIPADNGEKANSSALGKRKRDVHTRLGDIPSEKVLVECPICDKVMDEIEINHHLDTTH